MRSRGSGGNALASEVMAAAEPNGRTERKRDPFDGTFVTKLTDEVIADVTTAIRAGASLDTAASYVGIARSTFHNWLSAGRNAIRRADGSTVLIEEEYRQQVRFVVAVEEALSEFKLNLTGGILQHGRESWQALAWLAERKFPAEFSRRTRIDHANADGTPFMVAPTPVFDPSKLTDEELEQAIALLNKARPDGLRAPEPSGRNAEILEIEKIAGQGG